MRPTKIRTTFEDGETRVVEINPPKNAPKVQINFSLPSKYNGEFGFDFVDDKNKMGIYYMKTLKRFGLNTETNKPELEDLNTISRKKIYKGRGNPLLDGASFLKKSSSYKKWKKSFKNTIEIDWKKKLKRKDYVYYSPVISLVPNKNKAILHVNIEIEGKNPNNIKIVPQRKDTGIIINKEEIEPSSGRMTGFLTIECTLALTTDLKIDFIADNQLCGQLVVVKNLTKKIDVLEVFVKTKKNSAIKKINYKTTTNIFNQALIELNIRKTKKELNLSKHYNDDKPINGHDFLDLIKKQFDRSKHPNIDVFLFFCDRKAIGLSGISSHSKNIAICFAGHRKTTIPHEICHSIGLSHTFTNTAKHIYLLKFTNNIMDYSTKRTNLFQWQWKQLKQLIIENRKK